MGMELIAEIRRELMDQLSRGEEWTDQEIREKIDDLVIQRTRKSTLTVTEKARMGRELFYSVRKLDVLQELLEDDSVTEIMVNGFQNIFVERDGQRTRWEKSFTSREKLEDVIQQIAGKCNRVINENQPIVDARLSGGQRVNAVVYPVALDGPILTIRKFPEPVTMEKLLSYGSISEEAAVFLQKLVEARYNIFVSGGTGAGKTTFLNALSEFIPSGERVITIEDSAELRLRHIENLVRLETREANAEGQGAIGIGMLIRAALRMRPDRILIGEVRGKEALDLLQAMNTGHDGSFSTGHANSPRDMLARLETMVLMAAELPLPAIRSQIASAVDIMVHVARLRDKSRKVTAIEEVDRYENGEIILNSLYRFQEHEKGGEKNEASRRVEGSLEKTGELRHREKLRMAGIKL